MPSSRQTQLTVGSGLAVILLWVYWPTLTEVAKRWSDDPKYSHGYLVPLFSSWLLWRGRQIIPRPEGWVGSWWGLSFVLPAVALHLAGTLFFLGWLSEFSFLPALAGLTWCLGGRPLLRAAAPAIAFLGFMLPLPYRLEVALGLPLQNLATVASSYFLQMCGLTAAAEGNTILVNDGKLAVVEACSGLGMLVTFFALTTAVAIVLERPLLDKLIVVVSAVPVAVIANVIRISATGVLFATVGGRAAQVVYHDLAGWLMMPLALGMIWVELKILSHLLVEIPVEGVADYGLGTGIASHAVRAEPDKSGLARR